MRIHTFRFTLLISTLLFAGSLTATARGAIDSEEDLAKALRDARPGDTIVIADRHYDGWSVEVDCPGTVEGPLRFDLRVRVELFLRGILTFR